MTEQANDFEAMKARLDEIVDEVSAEGISLDDALALYEEAVKLGLSACDVSEADILVSEDEPVEGAAGAFEGGAPDGAAPADAAEAEADGAANADAAPEPAEAGDAEAAIEDDAAAPEEGFPV